ncbi:unnamed protein product [Owenia fusiformis]|uniref:Uncharacterized protein n=1 Tax=Owenia fusiformis TaxID=6347 RepID=A0A8J1YAK3_OWEFU|nr:unnamed protein product [Owenia fusiformis]
MLMQSDILMGVASKIKTALKIIFFKDACKRQFNSRTKNAPSHCFAKLSFWKIWKFEDLRQYCIKMIKKNHEGGNAQFAEEAINPVVFGRLLVCEFDEDAQSKCTSSFYDNNERKQYFIKFEWSRRDTKLTKQMISWRKLWMDLSNQMCQS